MTKEVETLAREIYARWAGRGVNEEAMTEIAMDAIAAAEVFEAAKEAHSAATDEERSR